MSSILSGVLVELRSSPGPKTGCSGRGGRCRPSRSSRCDPHPVRRPGAAPRCGRACAGVGRGCDPHPVRRPGAAMTPYSVRVSDLGCDPHPVRRPGAALATVRQIVTDSWLRSSPGPKTGCSATGPDDHAADLGVAILTRSEDRVQRQGIGFLSDEALMLRSSPGPKTGCSHAVGHDLDIPPSVAILTRSEDRVQLRSSVTLPIHPH